MVKRRSFTDLPGFSSDFYAVHDFLVRLNQQRPHCEGFLWGRWEWMFCRHSYDAHKQPLIGIWEHDGAVVALATFEDQPGDAFLVCNPEYSFLRNEMLDYAREHLGRDGALRVLIRDGDLPFQELAAARGFLPTQEREHNAVLMLRSTPTRYTLPAGFRVVSLAEEYNLYKYHRVLWRGFDHPGDAPDTPDMLNGRREQLSGPHVDLSLNIAIVAPHGEFVSYCGMWHLPGSAYALVEPVATDPDYRRLGLGRAAVLEAVRRCGTRGAQMAFVGSAQQFYYAIGFRPYSTETWWRGPAGPHSG